MITSLPQRLRESSFRRYEEDIAAIVSAYPLAYQINPQRYGLEATTVVGRIRDAKLSLKLYRWSPTKVDMSKFDQIESDLIFSHKGERIVCGSREAIKIKQHLLPTGQILSEDEPLLNDPPLEFPKGTNAKEAICDLIARGLCRPLRVIGFDSEQIDHLEASYDVRIDQNADGTQTIS